MTGQSLPAGVEAGDRQPEAVRRQALGPGPVVREVAESAGGSLESYYWMFGQYDGAAVFSLPDSQSMATVSLAITSSGALSRFETQELIESGDLTAIAERAKAITYRPPGT